MRIAMWSGPRNLSTAMMYSFASRADFAVIDEPFYAAFLHRTGAPHPMREEILAAHPIDNAEIAAVLTGSVPDGKLHFYQKHMCHHMVAGVTREWMEQMCHVFLIRHPARVIASYAAKHETPSMDEIGVELQAQMFDAQCAKGPTPLVIDSADIRTAPEKMLRALCEALKLTWDPAMLFWTEGGHPADGVWAKHWYGTVHRSTGFAGPEGPLPALRGEQQDLMQHALPNYERLRVRALKCAE